MMNIEQSINKEKAARIAALATYEHYGECSPDELVRDVLSDLRHFCDAYSVAFGEQDRIAHSIYLDDRQKARFPEPDDLSDVRYHIEADRENEVTG